MSVSFPTVWDALESDRDKRALLQLRAELMGAVIDHIRDAGLTQQQAGELLGISQPRVSRLLKGDFAAFRLDSLVLYALRCGRDVRIATA